MANKLKITDVVLRDAHQSLFATRMKIEDMLPITGQLDRVGYWSLESWGGATFDSCIRFLNEDPWERIARLKKAMPNTPMQMLLRGQNLLGYRHYGDDVVEAFVKEAAQNVDVFRVFDALNDIRNLKTSIAAVKKAKKHAQGTISYTTSPVHTLDTFVKMGKELQEMGCDSICIKDMAGLIMPADAFSLVSSLKKSLDIPIHLHTHATTGLSTTSIYKAAEAGVDIVDTAISTMALGTSHSPTEAVVAMLRGSERDPGLDIALLAEIAEYFKGVRKNYAQFESAFIGVDTGILISQVPGGMLSNMESQLKDMNALDRMKEVLEEMPRVREDFGFPPLVTPTSQIVGTQAVFNVLQGRYKTITKESKAVLRGEYGRCPGKVNEEVRKLALGDDKPIDHRPADDIPAELEDLKKKIGSKARDIKDVLTYALFPQIAEKFFETRGKTVEAPKPVVVQAPAAAPAAVPAGGTMDFSVVVDGRAYAVTVAPGKGGVPQVGAISPVATPAAPAAPAAGGGRPVKAPMPGAVLKIIAPAGTAVKEGDPIIVIEAMKMETPIAAPCDGTVAAINVKVGEHVQTEQIIALMG